ncbi:type II toxin-antitoxin system RelE/ParE family toxin [Thiohalocapsa marina]|uniref:type II toxin-antitoxin system RelE/ParE family toxin n=1 Tax=Thiohalocapsa marina TaxID=424902 RepID=UPI0036D8DCC7
MREVRVLEAVYGDLDAGVAFYASKDARLGEYFWDCLLADIQSLSIYAGVHQPVFDCYRMIARRFPYGIYYRVDAEVATVVAVLPLRRDPVWLNVQLNARN